MPCFVYSIFFDYFKSSLSTLNILPCGHQFQVFHSSLIRKKHQVFYVTNLMIFVLFLYLYIDHIDLSYCTEFEQGQLKDIHNWGQGYKKCSKIIAFLTYTHCYFIKACCLNSQQGETLLLFWYSLFIQSAGLIM